MARFDRVPVVEVHKENLTQVWPSLLLSIKSASFIAIDTELSGLGNRKLLNAKDLDDRYHHMCEVARTRSIVSLGLSCFKLLPPGGETGTKPVHTPGVSTELHFQVQTYNILTLCSDQYVVEPTSLRFLVEHGFDFNSQYSCGLPYHRGNDKDGDEPGPSVRQLFVELILSRLPLVLHNGVVDLVFLYHSLYASLPTTQQAFLAALADLFPAGIYDTKYVSDFKARLGASYLEFVFRRCQRDNMTSEQRSWSHVRLSFLDYPTSENVAHQACGLPDLTEDHSLSIDALCMQYANHGWCPQGSDCPKSHDIDLILETQDRALPSKRHKKPKITNPKETADAEAPDANSSSSNNGHSPEGSTELSSPADGSSSTDTTISSAGSHRAGFDAFMTGFIFGFFSARYGKVTDDFDPDTKGSELGMDEYKNRAYLVGKDIPLQIMKSSFVKSSKDHRGKLKKIGFIC